MVYMLLTFLHPPPPLFHCVVPKGCRLYFPLLYYIFSLKSFCSCVQQVPSHMSIYINFPRFLSVIISSILYSIPFLFSVANVKKYWVWRNIRSKRWDSAKNGNAICFTIYYNLCLLFKFCHSHLACMDMLVYCIDLRSSCKTNLSSWINWLVSEFLL